MTSICICRFVDAPSELNTVVVLRSGTITFEFQRAVVITRATSGVTKPEISAAKTLARSRRSDLFADQVDQFLAALNVDADLEPPKVNRLNDVCDVGA